MVMKLCPRCSERFSWIPTMGEDFIHDCGHEAAGSALKFESVPVMGKWDDYTGAGSAFSVNLQGKGSKSSGKRIGIDNIDSVNIHGKRKATHRLRRHEEYIPIEVK